MIKLYTGLSNCDVRMHCIGLNRNDTSIYQSMAKTYEITNLVQNVKKTQNCDECLMYKLFMMISSRNINI